MLFNVISIISFFTLLKAEAGDYLGCYEATSFSKFLVNNNITERVKTDDKLTPKTCIDLCRSRQLPYAALQQNICRCDQYKPPAKARVPDEGCKSTCPGDNRIKCGNAGPVNRESVYETEGVGFELLHGPMIEFTNATSLLVKCHEYCYQKGYRLYGLDGNNCSCGDDSPDITNIPIVYFTGIPNIPEIGRFVGCFVNSQNGGIKPDIVLELNETNSNQRCLNICDLRGFQYAGVQNGALCSCTNQVPGTALQKPGFICEQVDCPGEISAKCGSEDAVKIFSTRNYGSRELTKPRYLGCYTAEFHYRQLYETKVSNPGGMTVDFCIGTCTLQGYTYSSLMYGFECYCSYLYQSEGEKEDLDACKVPCAGGWIVGKQRKYCGGRYRRDLYHNGLPDPMTYASYSYVGCYKDEFPLRQVRKKMEIEMNNLSPALCQKHCLFNGFMYFGVQYDQYKVCFCSDEDDIEYEYVHDPLDQLSGSPQTPDCISNNKSIIFTSGLVQIDDISENYRGCYVNNGIVLRDRIFYFMKALTPKRCIRLCDMLGFAYSGVNSGWDCQCGNKLPDLLPRQKEEKCDIRCPGDPKETCGGSEDHMKVYRTFRPIPDDFQTA